MTGEECFAVWAPEDSVWSRWVRPVLFAQMDTLDAAAADIAEPQPVALPSAQRGTALVLEIAGAAAVRTGIELARQGFRPVPLFNGTHGPAPLIDVRPIARELQRGAEALAALSLPDDAPPAFLLDVDRMTPKPEQGRYDNRWVVLPQDFPSGTLLRSRGIERVVLVLPQGRTLAHDLAHVMLRWQEAGITIQEADAGSDVVHDVVVKKPAWYRRASWALIALMGLRRSNVGGFGGVIPVQTSGSGYS